MADVANPIHDFLAVRGSEDREIDLTQVFSGEDLTFTVASSDPSVAAATIEGGKLTLDFLETIGHSDITITATDAFGATVTDYVRVRVTGENAYTIAVLPDTQNYTDREDLNHVFGDMTRWLVDNRDDLNIKFVTHVGDVTQHNTAEEWAVAEEAMRILDGEIPYSLLPGNHDQSVGGKADDHSSVHLDELFSPESQAAVNSTFGGAYDMEPDSARNTYHTFEAPDGTKWLLLSLEFGAREDVLRWAGDVIEGHADHRVMITSHSITNFMGRHDSMGAPLFGEGTGYDYGMGAELSNATDGETMWRVLADRYPNVAMTFSGHIFGDGAETVTSYNQYGQPVYQMLVNYQDGVSEEITGNGDASQGGRGGNGAIRLITIDPESGAIHTSTYFTEFDDYLDGGREDGELAGRYMEHEELITGVDLGPVGTATIAMAGDDMTVTAEAGEETATVSLDATHSILPENGTFMVRWLDADGNVVAEGAMPDVELGIGMHRLTLELTDEAGDVARDEILVRVAGDRTLFVEDFNDGDAVGWTSVRALLAQSTRFFTASEAGLPALPGGEADVMTMPGLEGTQGYLVTPGFEATGGGDFTSYTLMMDILVEDGDVDYFSFFQNDLTNENDGAIFLENNDDGTASIEILRGRHGSFTYDEWHRVAFAVQQVDAETVSLTKYIDGVKVGQQNVPAERLAIDGDDGFILFADDNGESGRAHVSSLVFSDRVFDEDEVAGYGAASADAPAVPDDGRTVSFDFADRFAPNLGDAAITIIDPKADALEAQSAFDTPEALGVAPLPGGDGADDQALYFPAPKPAQGFHVDPATDAAELKTYSLIMDLLIPSGQGRYMSLLQTDLANDSDGDVFLRNNNDGSNTAGLGGGGYDGAYAYDQWARIALVVEEQADGTMTLSKYIDGALVGVRTDIDAERFTLDGEGGFYLFVDEDGEMSNAYVSSVAFSETAFGAEAIAALGGAQAGGIFDAAPDDVTTQFDMSGDLSASFGDAGLSFRDESDRGLWMVKGSIHSRTDAADGLEAGQGALYYSSDNADKTLVWDAEEARDWSDYVYDVTLESLDDDVIGAVFYFQDAANHYRVTFDLENNRRQLIRVADGEETVLAESVGGYRFADKLDLRIAVSGDEIVVLLDDRDVFGGPVRDADPLTGGTVGVHASNEKSAIFDDVMVNRIALTAHGEAEGRVIAEPGADDAYVSLSAASSFGPDELTGFRWLLDGEEIARGREVEVRLPVGTQAVVLEATDASGAVSRDHVAVDVVSGDAVLLADGFGDGAMQGWTIVDEGDIGGPSDWVVEDGALVQRSDIHSKQMTSEGASDPDPWKQGWSPKGDGMHALRKGTYALYSAEEAKEWTDYSVEVTLDTPDDDGMGVLFHYQDPENYYKFELDDEGGLWNLRRMVDGYEKTLAQVPGTYEQDAPIQLRVDIEGGRIQAYVNGDAVFAYAVEDHALEQGTVALYSWGSEGVTFDDVRVISLAETPAQSAPVAVDDAGFSVVAGAQLMLDPATLLANDADADGDAMQIVAVGAAVGGVVAMAEDGTIIFVPNADFEGEARFDYTVSDGHGGIDVATVTLTVEPREDGGETPEPGDGGETPETPTAPNALPDARDDAGFVIASGARLTIAAAALLANDADADGDALSLAIVGNAVGGRVSMTDGGVRFDAAAGFVGEASFEYALSDGMGGFDTAHVAIEVLDIPGGTSGDDVLHGALSQANILRGGAGRDVLHGGGVDDLLSGGSGDDALYARDGADRLSGGSGDDRLSGGRHDDRLFGGEGNDLLLGNTGRDTLRGEDGDDWLKGGLGSDRLFGGAGDDRLEGGRGDDWLIGGAGEDVFVFGPDAAGGHDVIGDFTVGEDRIELTGLGFATAAEAFAALEDTDDGVRLTFGDDDAGGELLLKGVSLDALGLDDFLIG